MERRLLRETGVGAGILDGLVRGNTDGGWIAVRCWPKLIATGCGEKPINCLSTRKWNNCEERLWSQALFRSPLWLLLLLVVAVVVVGGGAKESPKFEMTKEEQTLLELLNKERKKNDLPALRPHPLLFKAAAACEEHGQTTENGTQSGRQETAGSRGGRRIRLGQSQRKHRRGRGRGTAFGRYCQAMDGVEDAPRKPSRSQEVNETGLGIARNDKDEIYYAQDTRPAAGKSKQRNQPRRVTRAEAA